MTGDSMPGRNQTPPPSSSTRASPLGRPRSSIGCGNACPPSRVASVRLSGRSRRLNSALADLPWRIVIGLVLAGLPIALLALFAGGWSVSMAGIAALALIALAAYLADWVGGLSALAVSLLLLDLLFVDRRTGFAQPAGREDRVSLLVFHADVDPHHLAGAAGQSRGDRGSPVGHRGSIGGHCAFGHRDDCRYAATALLPRTQADL